MIPSSISSYLDRNRATYAVLPHPTAYTAQQEAAAAHVPGAAWAKAVVCIADEQPLLAVLPASRRVDLSRLLRVLNVGSVRLAQESEFADLYGDCEIGAMPPLGSLYDQRVFVDRTLTTKSQIAFNAGSHRDAISMSYREFERLVHPAVAEFAAAPSGTARPKTLRFTDPVCGEALEESRSAAWSAYGEKTYRFCSLSCKMEFDDNPEGYSRSKLPTSNSQLPNG
jgi:Ala-tRNA(Pro) deacylase